jgi:hypothetical protein
LSVADFSYHYFFFFLHAEMKTHATVVGMSICYQYCKSCSKFFFF